ncbi:MAG TPA: CPBP family intramembrane glutamic endopeptidase [Candidatus Acidoferrales bacterium]|nr:CPBP family intramembrane glutamic endopeptidase [Candidatus Acidoferrales bacterium]
MVIFKGSNGVRAGWRAAGFLVLSLGLVLVFEGYLSPLLAGVFHVDVTTLNAAAMLCNEVSIFIAVVLSTALCAVLEHRRIDGYGLPLREAFRRTFWEGIATGVVLAALVGVLMYAAGGFVITGFALSGTQWIVQPLLWAGLMVLVGIAEEYWFRGYFLQSMARGMGFWPAAVVSTLVFGGLHLTKAHENFIDIFNIMALGLLLCFALQRTGSLWLAVGFHCAFDFMQFFVIGTRNGGNQPVGTLLHASFPGPAWVNGGPLGTEASYFMLPAMLLLFGYLAWRYPAPRALDA